MKKHKMKKVSLITNTLYYVSLTHCVIQKYLAKYAWSQKMWTNCLMLKFKRLQSFKRSNYRKLLLKPSENWIRYFNPNYKQTINLLLTLIYNFMKFKNKAQPFHCQSQNSTKSSLRCSRRLTGNQISLNRLHKHNTL